VPLPPVSEMQVHAKEIKQVLETCLIDRLKTCKETDTFMRSLLTAINSWHKLFQAD